MQLDMIPGVNIIDKKVRIASVNGAGGGILGFSENPAGVLGG